MHAEQKAKAYAGIIFGFIVQAIGRGIANISYEGAVIGAIIGVGGVVLFVWGCMNFAEVKGHSKWLGLLGLLSCVGLLIMILIPEKRPRRF
jgi:hypothetical protein